MKNHEIHSIQTKLQAEGRFYTTSISWLITKEFCHVFEIKYSREYRH